MGPSIRRGGWGGEPMLGRLGCKVEPATRGQGGGGGGVGQQGGWKEEIGRIPKVSTSPSSVATITRTVRKSLGGQLGLNVWLGGTPIEAKAHHEVGSLRFCKRLGSGT